MFEFIYIQIETDNLLQFLSSKFGKVDVIESYQKFVRTKIVENHKLSELFGQLERNVSVSGQNLTRLEAAAET